MAWNGVNSTSIKNVYPTAQGATIAQQASGSPSAPSVRQGADSLAKQEMSDPRNVALAIGSQGNAAIAGLVLLGLLFGLMFLAKRLGTDDDFKSIKPTLYNVLTISLAAVIGAPIWKFAATKFPVKGVSTWVLAA